MQLRKSPTKFLVMDFFVQYRITIGISLVFDYR